MPIIGLILGSLLFWGLYWFFRMGGLEQIREKHAQRKDAERSAKPANPIAARRLRRSMIHATPRSS
jgi:hypothetical protein